MVKVLYRQRDGYNVAVYPNDHEPAHVHVTKERMQVVVFLEPIEFGPNDGLGRADLKRIRKLISENKTELIEKWIEYHGVPGSEGY